MEIMTALSSGVRWMILQARDLAARLLTMRPHDLDARVLHARSLRKLGDPKVSECDVDC